MEKCPVQHAQRTVSFIESYDMCVDSRIASFVLGTAQWIFFREKHILCSVI